MSLFVLLVVGLVFTSSCVLNRHTFLGSLHEIKSRDASTQNARFAVLDGIQDAILVINAQGVVQFSNARLEKLLGVTAGSLLGKNVSTLMPEPYSSSHDGYIQHYLKVGKAKIIGKGGRIVVALHSSGGLVPVHLEVDECILGKSGCVLYCCFVTHSKKKNTKKHQHRGPALLCWSDDG